MRTAVFSVLFLLAEMQGIPSFSQALPVNRRTDWSRAGYGGRTTGYSTVVSILNYGGSGNGITPNDDAFQQAVGSLSGQPGIIFFPAGTYIFNRPVTLRSNLLLKGAGPAATVLDFNLGGQSNLINVFGNSTQVTDSLALAAIKEDNHITVHQPGRFSVNDYIKLYQRDAALVNDIWALESVAQLLRIDSISGNRLFFSTPLRKNFLPADTLFIRKLEMVEGVGIECLRIRRLDASSQQTANIRFNFAARCWVKGVESDSCNFAHVQIANSSGIEISNSYFHGAFAYGPSGQGYGISCEYSSGDCLVENNVFRNLRHAMLLQSGANGNVFSANYSTDPFKTDTIPYDFSGDLVLHGNYPFLNLFEGNIVQNIVIDASHGRNGPFNTFLRNRAERYGFFISPGMGDSTNIIGNEISGTGLFQGNYFAAGSGLLQLANNKQDTILPPGTGQLMVKSYRYANAPAFWNSPSRWAGIGPPHLLKQNNIPARERYWQSSSPAYCLTEGPVNYRFTGNGNWSDSLNWAGMRPPPSVLYEGSEISIEPQAGQVCVLDIPFVVQPGIRLTVSAGAIVEIISHLTLVQ